MEADIYGRRKKITNESLTEDELDKVTGGTIAETAADSLDLYRRGLVDKVYVGSQRTRRVINFFGNKDMLKNFGGVLERFC